MEFHRNIEIGAAKVGLRPDGIVLCSPSHYRDIGKVDAQELIDAIYYLSPRPVPLLFDLRIPHSMTFEAQDILRETQAIRALAILVSSSMGRLAAEFLIQAHRTAYPAELFSHEDSAIDWLLEYL